MQYYTSEDYPYLVAYLNRKTTWKLSDVSQEYEINLKSKSKHHKHDKLFRKILNDKEEIVKLINVELYPQEKIKVEDIEKYEDGRKNSRIYRSNNEFKKRIKR